MKFPPKETPWGEWQRVQEVIPGVFRVSTVSHGGYWLTPERLAELPTVLRDGPDGSNEKPYSVDDVRAGWFEEDSEAGRVVLMFCVGNNAGAFPAGLYDRTKQRYESEYPETVKQLRDAGFFDRGKPKAANPTIVPAGSN